jgi:hypothetical protein
MPIDLHPKRPRFLRPRDNAFSENTLGRLLHDWRVIPLVALVIGAAPLAIKAINEADDMTNAINAGYEQAIRDALCRSKPGLPVGAMALVKPGVIRDVPGRGNVTYGPMRLTIEQNGVTVQEDGKITRTFPLPDCRPS